MKMLGQFVALFAGAGLIFFCSAVAASEPAAGALEPLAQSQAYQEFLKKPQSDFAKMICILNYFRTAPVMVQYEGVDYSTQVAYPVGLVYLMTHYRDENPEAWVRKTCYRSLVMNSVIYLKFRDGSYRPMRDVLIEKYHELEEALAARASQS